MEAPIWVARAVVLALHDEQIAEHGGASGVRNEGLPDSALSRPINRLHYDPGSDVATLAGSYAFGLAANHPFVDGNKRVSLVVTETFLMLNGFELVVDDQSLTLEWIALAAGQVTEEDLINWLRPRIVRSEGP